MANHTPAFRMAAQAAQQAANGNGNAGTNGTDEKPQAQLYANVGAVIQLPNAETGEPEDVFVTIGGISVDTMPNSKIGGQLGAAKDWLRDHLMGVDVAPGTEVALPFFEVRLRRRAGVEEKAAAQAENPIIAALAGKLRAVK